MKTIFLWLMQNVVSRFVKVYVRYWHHNSLVVARMDLAGKHRSHCLCYDCDRFKPGSQDHCKIASSVYQNCVRFNIVTPVWECPDFKERDSHDSVREDSKRDPGVAQKEG